MLPTIIKNSKIYSVRHDRLYLPEELLAAMGFPLFSNDAGSVSLKLPSHFVTAMAEAKPNVVKNMTGNSMALCQVGAVLALILVSACHEF